VPIERGQDWGSAGELPADAPVVGSDSAAAELIGSGQPLGVESGDLARTLGVRQPFNRAGPKQLLPCDAISVVLDDAIERVAVAHVVAWR